MVGRYSRFFYGIGSGLFWGLDAVLVAWVLAESPLTTGGNALLLPLCVIAVHDIASAFWLLIFTTWQNNWKKLWVVIRSHNAWIMVVAALCGGPVGMSFYVLAIQSVGPGVAAVISATYPALGVLFAVIFGRDKLKKHQMMGLTLAIGATMALSWSPVGDGISFIGVLFGLCCAIGWGVECVICSYGFAKEIPPDVALQIRQLVSGLTYAGVILPLFGVTEEWVSLMTTPTAILPISFVAFVGTLSYLFYYRAINGLGPIRAMGLNITYSAWAVVLGMMIMGEEVSFRTGVVSACIISGSLWTAAPWSVWYKIWRNKR